MIDDKFNDRLLLVKSLDIDDSFINELRDDLITELKKNIGGKDITTLLIESIDISVMSVAQLRNELLMRLKLLLENIDNVNILPYKGKLTIDKGYFYAPYIPLSVVNVKKDK